MKDLWFVGSARDDLRQFPTEARRAAGYELRAVQSGLSPSDFKPMPSVGAGAYEIRIRKQGAWRVIYVAKMDDAVYVLHAFAKKTERTPAKDIEIAARRCRQIGG